jgi:hypothetical protein
MSGPGAQPADALDARLARIKAKIAARGLKLRECVPLPNLERWEQENGIRLPDGYRRFVLEIGNGGSDPDVGAVWNRYGADIRKPFPFTEAWSWEGQDPDEARIQTTQYGCMHLAGDRGDWLLVVTGLERGQMWYLSDFGVQPCDPPCDFLDWYEYRLDGGDDFWSGAASA